MDSLAYSGLIFRCLNDIRVHEASERRLAQIIHDPPIKADGTWYDNKHQSKHELRCHLYEIRRQVYLLHAYLRDMIEILRILEPDLAEDLHRTQDQDIRHWMDRLKHEDSVYNATIESALSNTRYVFKNRWLMYNFTQVFGDVAGNVPHPGGEEPDIFG
ncbi:hypothetical protein BGX29_007639 [Mortierella sp. GBA35]|nr:hypothetical protein BGX29_007639 [Mortierella sp. GBA35]